MDLLIYTSLTNDALKRLVNVIDNEAADENTEIFNSLNRLANRIFQIKKHRAIVILLIKNKNELTQALSFRDFFDGIKLILILPNHTKKTVDNGHKLFPNFLSFKDSDFSDVGAVLNKMISNIRDGGSPPCQPINPMETEEQEGCLS